MPLSSEAGVKWRNCEINHNANIVRFAFTVDALSLSKSDIPNIIRRLSGEQRLACDLQSKSAGTLPHLYASCFGHRFVDMQDMYEDIFDRIPLSLVRYHYLNIFLPLRPGSPMTSSNALDAVISRTGALLASSLVYMAINLTMGARCSPRNESRTTKR